MNMKLVIEIDEDLYETCRDSLGDEDNIEGIIANGIPLPKGHGDLIDRNDLLADSYCIDDWSGNEINIVDVMTVKMADTILEADTAGSEE